MLSEAKHRWLFPCAEPVEIARRFLAWLRMTIEMTAETMKWVCCQLGAREHYAIPRALLRLGMLEYLLTDAWVPPSSFPAKIYGRGSKLAERFHDELHDAPVKAFNSSLILFEMLARARGLSGWAKIVARNRWFQRKVVSFLSLSTAQLSTLNSIL